MIKKIKENTVFKNKFMEVCEDQIEHPDGSPGNYTYIKRSPGVIIIPKLDTNRYLLVKEYRYPLQKWLISFPSGKVEINEEVLSAANRELKEETGYSASQCSLLCQLNVASGYSTALNFFVKADGLQIVSDISPSEPIELLVVDTEELVNMVFNASICSEPTLAAIGILSLMEVLK